MLRSLGKILRLKIHISKNDVYRDEDGRGEEHTAGRNRTSKVWCLIASVLLQIGSQTSNDARHIQFRIVVAVDLRDLGQRLRIERHFAIYTCQLHVGPGTNGLDCHILLHSHIDGTRTKGGITMGNVVVAIVDDTVIDVG